VVNTHQQPTGHFAQQADWEMPFDQVKALIEESVDNRADFINATRLATALMGDSIATNLFMLGFAYQKGAIPVSDAAILRAIELNGVAIESNKKSFLWGRRAAVDLKRVESIAIPGKPVVLQMPQSLDTLVKRRVAFLTDYQDAAWAAQYQRTVEDARAAEGRLGAGSKFAQAVAKSLFKLMAYKDEYEVARLYTDGQFTDKLKQQFDGDFTIKFNLAPPLLAKKDGEGHLVKAQYGSWTWQAFKLLAKLKKLRGTKFDIFGYTDERRMERALIVEYRKLIESMLPKLTADNLATAIDIAALPEKIRGFGHVKDKAVAQYRTDLARLLAKFEGRAPQASAKPNLMSVQ
jgi:indolepyruvate ferredoxin oxidoreductase